MGMNEPLNLLIYDHGQESFFSYRWQRVIEGESFMLSSMLLQHFGQIISDVLRSGYLPDLNEIEAALQDFYLDVTGVPEIMDQPIPLSSFDENYRQLIKGFDPGPDERGMISYLAEVVALYAIIKIWFDPREVSSGQRKAKHWLRAADNNFFFKHRCREYHSCPTFVNHRFTFVHDSPGILPLCWVEMLHGLQGKLKASVCPYCHNVYLYPSNNFRKATCGSAACKKAYLVEKHGGVEGYRSWEAERKKNSGGKRGRPRKEMQ